MVNRNSDTNGNTMIEVEPEEDSDMTPTVRSITPSQYQANLQIMMDSQIAMGLSYAHFSDEEDACVNMVAAPSSTAVPMWSNMDADCFRRFPALSSVEEEQQVLSAASFPAPLLSPISEASLHVSPCDSPYGSPRCSMIDGYVSPSRTPTLYDHNAVCAYVEQCAASTCRAGWGSVELPSAEHPDDNDCAAGGDSGGAKLYPSPAGSTTSVASMTNLSQETMPEELRWTHEDEVMRAELLRKLLFHKGKWYTIHDIAEGCKKDCRMWLWKGASRPKHVGTHVPNHKNSFVDDDVKK